MVHNAFYTNYGKVRASESRAPGLDGCLQLCPATAPVLHAPQVDCSNRCSTALRVHSRCLATREVSDSVSFLLWSPLWLHSTASSCPGTDLQEASAPVREGASRR